ncbi:MAG: HAMP domain-containing sensor histidine kinase [Candidatus Limivivens sp.]|nr:HAMP domain-containing sensor histidine kinase [Candidatus Limivivens sp.]
MIKFRSQAVLAFSFFLVILVGGSGVFYLLFAEDYYIARKKKVMNQAYEQVKSVDLSELASEGNEVLQELEDESFSVIICDEEFQLIYASKAWSVKALIGQMKERQEQYVPDAEAVYQKDIIRKPISLYGLVLQEDELYYVYLYEYTTVIRRSIDYVNRFLIGVLGVALLAGSAFAWIVAGKIAGPIEQIRQVSEKIAGGDLSARIVKRMPNYELIQLKTSINQMADKIQKDMNDLNNYNYLLLHQNRSMVEFEENRKKFVRNVTHELKTPLAIISSQVEMLEIEQGGENQEYYYQSIMEEIEKMSKLISNLLHSSFEESPVPNPQMGRGDLSETLSGLLPQYEIWLRSKGLVCRTELEEGCFAVFDETEMELAVNNYLLNATSHARKGGIVRISLKKEEETVCLSVYNEGPGILPEEQDQIWNRYYQSGTGEKGAHPGEVGLGLYIVKDIVRLHQGSCGVVNRENGVEFWFRIPRA